MKFKSLMVALLFIGLAAPAKANNIIHVLVNQKTNIENGYRFGKISYFDARDLMREQVRIEKVILKAKKDGVITVREQAKIERLQRRADHNIWVASSISNRIYGNNNVFYDRYDPWNSYGYGWNQGYFNNGQACIPVQPGNTAGNATTTTPKSPIKPKAISKKTIRRN